MANYQNQINAAAELSSKEYNASQKANELAALGAKAVQTNPYKVALYTATANSLRDARGYALQIAAISENGYDPQLSAALKAASKTFVPAACHKRAGAYEIQADSFDKLAAKTIAAQSAPSAKLPPMFKPPSNNGNPYQTPASGGDGLPPLNPPLPSDDDAGPLGNEGGESGDGTPPIAQEPGWLVPTILLGAVAFIAYVVSKGGR